eukprot:1161325-Pelagomonas_calceolata.AAC.10
MADPLGQAAKSRIGTPLAPTLSLNVAAHNTSQNTLVPQWPLKCLNALECAVPSKSASED